MKTKHIYVDKQFQNKSQLGVLTYMASDLLYALEILIGDVERSPNEFTDNDRLRIARTAIQRGHKQSHLLNKS